MGLETGLTLIVYRPLVVGVLYNGQDAQPFAAGGDGGVDLPPVGVPIKSGSPGSRSGSGKAAM